MKTKEVLDKYCKIIGGILKCNPEIIKFEVWDTSTSPFAWREIGELNEEKQELYHWSLGKYRVIQQVNNVPGFLIISTFEIYQLPHCCAFMVSCAATVFEGFRNKRIGTVLNQLRQDMGRLLGYSAILCTDIEKNENQRKLLATNGWKDIHNLINKRTQNRVYLSVINL
jgi:hypothetical protein